MQCVRNGFSCDILVLIIAFLLGRRKAYFRSVHHGPVDVMETLPFVQFGFEIHIAIVA